jgi:hypothetical protein
MSILDVIMLVLALLLVGGLFALPALLKQTDRNDSNLHGTANSPRYWYSGS